MSSRSRSSRRGLGHGIVATAAEWVAREHALGGEEAAHDHAPPIDGLHRVLGARRRVAAGCRQLGAEFGLVEAQGREHGVLHRPSSARLARAAASIARKSAFAAPERTVTTRSTAGPAPAATKA